METFGFTVGTTTNVDTFSELTLVKEESASARREAAQLSAIVSNKEYEIEQA
jgi:hypothetical protein